MTQEQMNEIVKQRFEKMGIPSDVAMNILSQEPADQFFNITSPEKTSSGEVDTQEPVRASADPAEGQEWKADLIANLESHLSALKGIEHIQRGKTGIMFKCAGNYYSVKVTMHKKAPADFEE